MQGETLLIELEHLGLRAMIVGKGFTDPSVRDACTVRFDDLPELEDSVSPMGAALELVDQRLNLAGCRTAVIYLPHRSVSFRTIELPFTQSRKILQVLPFELESLLPLSETEYISDFYRPALDDRSNLVLTASAPEFKVGTCFDSLEPYGIKPAVVTHKGYAAAISFFKEHASVSSGIFVYLTHQGSTLVLIVDQKPCLVRTFGNNQSKPKSLARSVRQAVIGFRQRTGLDPEFEIVVRADDDGLNAYPVYICLQDELDMRFRLKTSMAEMHPNTAALAYEPEILTGRKLDKPGRDMINFCTGKYNSDSFIKTHGVQAAVTAGLAIVFTIFLLVSIGLENNRLKSRVNQLDQQAMAIFKAAFPEQSRIQDPYIEMKGNAARLLKNAGTSIGQTPGGPSIKILDLLSEFSARISTDIDIDLSRFLFNDGRVVLSGSTDNFNHVDQIKKRLESSERFKKVDISSAAADKSSGRVKFKFIIEL